MADSTVATDSFRVCDLINAPDSNLDQRLVLGRFLILQRVGQGRTHVLRADDDEATARVVEVEGAPTWAVNSPVLAECGTVLRGAVVVLQPAEQILCPVCAYAAERYL